MAKKGIVTCQYCKEKFDRTEVDFEHKGNKYYHKLCYDKKVLEKNNDPRKAMLDFIDMNAKSNHITVNFALIQKQINEYVDSGRYTISGLYGTLIYMVRIKKIQLDNKAGIALLPYLYNEAREFWAEQDSLSRALENKKEVKVVEVVVAPQKTKKFDNLIDIESLLEDSNNEQ